jgi:hypothetical protein
VVTFSGPMDLSAALQERSPELQNAVRSFLGCDESSACTIATEASPIAQVDPTDPPILLANSTEEIIPLDQATSMEAAVQAAGIDHELLEVPGRLHGFSYLSPVKEVAEGGTIQEAAMGFLVAQLTGQDLEPIPEVTATGNAPPGETIDKSQEGGQSEGNEGSGATVPLLILAILAVVAAAVEAGMIVVLRRQVQQLTFAMTSPYRRADSEGPEGGGPSEGLSLRGGRQASKSL